MSGRGKQGGEKLEVVFNIKLAPSMKARLEDMARLNDRTLAAEVRQAIRLYLQTHEERLSRD